MKVNPGEIITSYLKEKDSLFTADEFLAYLKESGIKITKSQVEDLLHGSDFVFSLINGEFITRAGVFLGRWFSFAPTKEEIAKGRFIIGHRCMPFCNPETNPDSITVVSHNKVVETQPMVFSMNLALDSFAMYGDGYVLPYIVNDIANDEISLADVQYSLPQNIKLTSWALSDLENGKNVEFGDRVLCRVVDWNHSIVEMTVLKKETNDLVVTKADIEREDWYSNFESGILENLERHGPSSSIEEQLAFLFLENQETLCNVNCGSIEEFLAHTTKIDFEPYGVETRIWKAGEVVPYVGEWNKHAGREQIILDLALVFTPQVIDSYIKDSIYRKKDMKNGKSVEEIFDDFFPDFLSISQEERNVILLNIKKRRDILEKEYNPFLDYNIAEIRERSLKLFSKVCSLLCSIGCSTANMSDFPQQELVILSQLFGHLVRLVEEFENIFSSERLSKYDIMLSLDGMEDTFDEIDNVLNTSLEEVRMKGFEIITDKS